MSALATLNSLMRGNLSAVTRTLCHFLVQSPSGKLKFFHNTNDRALVPPHSIVDQHTLKSFDKLF